MTRHKTHSGLAHVLPRRLVDPARAMFAEMNFRNAPRSIRKLGYVTLPLRPVKGRTVRVERIGTTTSQDAFNIKELENRDEVIDPEGRPNGGVLSIIEIEFYEPPAARETHTASAQ